MHTVFQGSSSPHVHSFIWILHAPNTEKEAAYIEFAKKITNSQLPGHFNNPELFKWLRLTKNIFTLELANNTTRKIIASATVYILLGRQFLRNYLIINFAIRKGTRF